MTSKKPSETPSSDPSDSPSDSPPAAVSDHPITFPNIKLTTFLSDVPSEKKMMLFL